MGKYMRKSKGTGGVSLMELKVSNTHTHPSLGVRTRAKTLALQRLQSSDDYSSAEGGGGGGGGGGGSFLQLRSRRLEKVTPIALDGRRQKPSQKGVNLQLKSSSSRLSMKGSEEEQEKVKGCLDGEQIEVEIKEENKNRGGGGGGGDLGVEETSFGENVLEFDGRERTTRESTPCSMIRDAIAITTPGSSTRPTTAIAESSLHNRENSVMCHIPTTNEMEEFFSTAEEQQQRKFIEKYNFDPVTDKPLPGRYEWVKSN